jgi:hypothetical protein
MEDVGHIESIKHIVGVTRDMTMLIYNHHATLAIYRSHAPEQGGALLRPAKTRCVYINEICFSTACSAPLYTKHHCTLSTTVH